MRKKIQSIFFSLLFVAVAIGITLYLSRLDIAVLNPKGMIAQKERDLIIITTLVFFSPSSPPYRFSLG